MATVQFPREYPLPGDHRAALTLAQHGVAAGPHLLELDKQNAQSLIVDARYSCAIPPGELGQVRDGNMCSLPQASDASS